MKRLRLACAFFFGWLFVFYNIERLHEPINIASFIYVLAALIAFPLTIVPRLQKVSVLWLLLPVVPLIVGLKSILGYAIAGPHLPITLTEIGALFLTIVLARQIGISIDRVRKSIISTVTANLVERSKPFAKGQRRMYREIRRARSFDRPVALLAIAPDRATVKVSLDRFTREVERELIHNYVRARIAELLTLNTRDYDIITHENGHFLALLPETDRTNALRIAEELRMECNRQFGFDLECGVSLFPDDEVTFVALLNRAKSYLSGYRRNKSDNNQSEKVAGNGAEKHQANGRKHFNSSSNQRSKTFD